VPFSTCPSRKLRRPYGATTYVNWRQKDFRVRCQPYGAQGRLTMGVIRILMVLFRASFGNPANVAAENLALHRPPVSLAKSFRGTSDRLHPPRVPRPSPRVQRGASAANPGGVLRILPPSPSASFTRPERAEPSDGRTAQPGSCRQFVDGSRTAPPLQKSGLNPRWTDRHGAWRGGALPAPTGPAQMQNRFATAPSSNPIFRCSRFDGVGDSPTHRLALFAASFFINAIFGRDSPS
jgi:hypothetical protein